MSDSKKLLWVLAALLSLLVLPYSGAYFYYGGKFPADHFAFPPLTVPDKAGFNLTIFIIIAVTFFVVASIYLIPRIYGFKKVLQINTAIKKTSLPYWFWIGFILWIVPLVILSMKFTEPKLLINWADIPMFWGFAVMMDGIVYARTGGKSILSQYPRILVGIGVASISGWLIFEYLNFFVDDNWAYPKGDLIPASEFVVYAFFGSSGLMPMAFEMYSFLNSFPSLRDKYSNGIKITLPRWFKWLTAGVCLLSLIFVNFLPNQLFFVIWLAPLFILAIVLSELKVWTPFTSIKDGNWAPTMLFALSFYLQGMLHEGWNYMSAIHENGQVVSANPDYWTYSIPYVNVLHWGEMPFLGLMGYLPFGIYCCVWWIAFSLILDIPTQFRAEQNQLDKS